MNTIHREQLLAQLNWRYATQQFDTQKTISSEDWATLEEALLLSPSSFGLQPWKFIVITDKAIREKLVPASYGQRKVADSSHLVVFAIKKNLSEKDVDDHLAQIAIVRGMPVSALAGLREMVIGGLINRLDDSARNTWSANQTHIALGNFITSAALLGIDTAPMGGFDPQQYNEILGLDKLGLSAVVICAAGYRSPDD
ncbi:MAG: NAD(P)H-dependent oxidoreductase, partial [Pedosphaera sp.]|nr:NAD(P)H-dependent oxidoreductase [Pedosphaera sp.]